MSEEPCTKLGAELSGYHDGVLDEATRLKVESHLQSCAVCRARLADYARADRAVASLGAPLFEDRLREELVAYTRATIADRGRQSRRQRQLERLRSWRTLVPLAAAAGVAVLVIKLTDGGFPSSSRRSRGADTRATHFESDAKSSVEADSQLGSAGADKMANGPPPEVAFSRPEIALGQPEAILGRTIPGEGLPEGAQGIREEAKKEPLTLPPATAQLETDQMLEESRRQAQAQTEALPAPTAAGENTPSEPATPLAKDLQAKAAEAPAAAMESPPAAESRTREVAGAKEQQSSGMAAAPTPQPSAQARALSAGRGHLDPQAALSIATLALQVGDLTGARLALQDFPTLPADSLTARAAVLALTLAERSRDLADCKAARERADALVEAAPGSALADTLRVRRAALPCPH